MGFDAKASCSTTILGLAQIPSTGRIPGESDPTRGLFDSFFRGGRDTGLVLAMAGVVASRKTLYFVMLVALSGPLRTGQPPLLRFRLRPAGGGSGRGNM
jgi:hypothetical protein